MAGCRIKSLSYHCKDDAWTPIESALIKLVRENPALYTRTRGNKTKKLLVSLMWSDIGEQLGLPECRCQEIWRKIAMEYAIVKRLHAMGYPVRNFPRSNKFFMINFSFLDNSINEIKDTDIPHSIFDLYRKKFSINGSVMRANCSFAAGPSVLAPKTSAQVNSSYTDTSEIAGASASSSKPPETLGAALVFGPSHALAKPNFFGVSEKTREEGLSQLSHAHGSHSKPGSQKKSISNTKAGSQAKSGPRAKSDFHGKSGASHSTGRKSKNK